MLTITTKSWEQKEFYWYKRSKNITERIFKIWKSSC